MKQLKNSILSIIGHICLAPVFFLIWLEKRDKESQTIEEQWQEEMKQYLKDNNITDEDTRKYYTEN